MKSDKIFDVDASYQGDKVKVIEFEAAFENAPIKVEISKTGYHRRERNYLEQSFQLLMLMESLLRAGHQKQEKTPI